MAFATAALVAGALRIFLLWASTRLAVASGADLSIEVYSRTLYQPYSVHVARNSSEVISGITNKINAVVFGVLLSFLTMTSSIVLLIAIMITLTVINPLVAFMSALGFGASYTLTTWVARRRLRQNSKRIAYEQTQVIKALQEGLVFQEAIRFEAVHFRYHKDTPWVLDGLNLTIPKGSRVGFVGSTGSGKSTTLDLLMALLTPTEGQFLVDGIPISGSRLRAWQRNIAHVPQSIYLADILESS